MQTYESPRTTGAESKKPRSDSLHVVCFSTYVADAAQQTERHQDVRNFLLALRGESFQGKAKIPVGQSERTLTSANANDSIDWFGEMVAHYLSSRGVRPPFGLVPVPPSKTTLESSAGPWTSLLAISIASSGLDRVSLVDVLRWKRALPAPGERALSVSELYENLATIREIQPGLPLILVDHLFTGSATLRASAARLSARGARVMLGLCAGRTATKMSYDPFTVVTGDIHQYRSGH